MLGSGLFSLVVRRHVSLQLGSLDLWSNRNARGIMVFPPPYKGKGRCVVLLSRKGVILGSSVPPRSYQGSCRRVLSVVSPRGRTLPLSLF